jgi:hypothetical protein
MVRVGSSEGSGFQAPSPKRWSQGSGTRQPGNKSQGSESNGRDVAGTPYSVPSTQYSVLGTRYSHSALCILFLAAVVHAGEPEPQPFVADSIARPISESNSSAPLRWQAKRPTPVSASELPAMPIAATSQPVSVTTDRSQSRPGWNITRIDPSVRPAQYASPDPFKDPFGDRQASSAGEPSLILQPTQAESSIETLPPPRVPAPLRSGPAAIPQLTAAQREGVAPPPIVGATPERSTVPCDRVYHDRNCCDLATRCNDFRTRLLTDSIRNISLDISPHFKITPGEVEDDIRTDRLRLLESRTWRDRRGRVVATGKMTNILNNSIVLVDESGREIRRIGLTELGEDELCYVISYWELPAECGLGGLRDVSREWMPSTFAWTASALCHKPLYFEEVQLERYGHTAGPFRQPFISGAHFFLNIAALPYNMAINPPHECQYALGYYRPGSCAPWMIPPIPLSLRGAAAETAAVLGGVFLIP